MKIKSVIKKTASLILLAALTLAVFGCAGTGSQTVDPAGHSSSIAKPAASIKATNLMAGITAKAGTPTDPFMLEKASPMVNDFAVRLMQAANEEGKNTLISPLSVMSALAMTANGAESETLAEMERVLGMSRWDLNNYFRSCIKGLAKDETAQLSLANSIWFTADERFTVNQDFLQCNADNFGADIFKAPFDEGTLNDINNWVKDNTHGMIPHILDRIPDDAVMYLVNALAFEAEWQSVYFDHQVHEGEFKTESGEVRKVQFMYSDEGDFLSCSKATGFMKPYRGDRYAFAALLPNEGVTVSELIASLDGQTLYNMLSEPSYASVQTSLPKFETGYATEMSEVLLKMGMPSAFEEKAADFSGLGTSTAGNIFISRVIHKTFISVGEKGTRAGAATLIEMSDCATATLEPRMVYLDRPFIYMLVDLETCTPFFIGTMMDVGE